MEDLIKPGGRGFYTLNTPLKEMVFEHIVPVDGGIYQAICRKFDVNFIIEAVSAKPILTFYKEYRGLDSTKEVCKNTGLWRRFFPTPSASHPPTVLWNGKEYEEVWEAKMDSELLIYWGKIDNSFPCGIKSKLLNNWSVCFSEEFLRSLYLPIQEKLLEMYRELKKI